MLYIKLDLFAQQRERKSLSLIYVINKPHKAAKQNRFLYAHARAKEQHKGVNDM